MGLPWYAGLSDSELIDALAAEYPNYAQAVVQAPSGEPTRSLTSQDPLFLFEWTCLMAEAFTRGLRKHEVIEEAASRAAGNAPRDVERTEDRIL